MLRSLRLPIKLGSTMFQQFRVLAEIRHDLRRQRPRALLRDLRQRPQPLLDARELMPRLIGFCYGRTRRRTQRLDLLDTQPNLCKLALPLRQLAANAGQFHTQQFAPLQRFERIFGIDARLRIAQRDLNAFGATRNTSLAPQRTKLAMNLVQQIVKPRQIGLGIRQFAQGTFLALAVLENAGSLFDEGPMPARIRTQNGVKSPLPYDHMHLLAEARVRQQLLNVEQTTRRAVDRIFRTTVTEDRTADRHLGVIDVEHMIRIVDRERHLRTPERRPTRRAREDHVLHRRAAQILRALLPHDPGQCVDDIRLAGAVRAHDRRDSRLEAQGGGGGERFEPPQGQFFEVHGAA